MENVHHSKKEGDPVIEEITSSIVSARGPHVNTACFSSAHEVEIQPFAIVGCDTASSQSKDDAAGLVMDLNSKDVSSTIEQNPFHPYKKLGQVKPSVASECGSTTGPLEEDEPLKIWMKMKQNGFLSSSHGGIPLPKQNGRQPRKRKFDEPKKKSEAPKREQASRFTQPAKPSGLFDRVDPGLFRRVRNCKQVHAILEAMVRSEEKNIIGQVGRGNDRRKYHNHAGDQFTLSLDQPNAPLLSQSRKLSSQTGISEKRLYNESSGYDDDTLALKLSSTVTMGADSVSSEHISSLSLKAASVASQWLELLQLDIKGRLAALRRSKKRVRNVIQTELPYLLSMEFSSRREIDPCTSNTHVARWRSLFSQMDKTLYDEAKGLENWLKQVEDMQQHCEKGLKFIWSGCLMQSSTSDDHSRSMKPTDVECEVMAAAASIYSTCNLIMTRGDLSCF